MDVHRRKLVIAAGIVDHPRHLRKRGDLATAHPHHPAAAFGDVADRLDIGCERGVADGFADALGIVARLGIPHMEADEPVAVSHAPSPSIVLVGLLDARVGEQAAVVDVAQRKSALPAFPLLERQ